MTLLTEALRATLLANGRRQQPLRGTDQEIDFHPVVRLFDPCGAATWLLTEIDPEEQTSPSGCVTSASVSPN